MQIRRHLRAVVLIGTIVLSGQLAQVRSAAGQPPSFNRLTHLVVDENRRGIRLFGVYDPTGPDTPIPYDRLLAEAFRLPEEQGDPMKLGSSPGFSLEPTEESRRHLANLKRFNNAQTARDAHKRYLSTPGPYSQLVEAGLEQALPEIRPAMKSLLYQRMDRATADETMDAVTTAADLMITIRLLQRNGVLKSPDPALARTIDMAILRYQTKRGNVFFYPVGTGEGMTGMTMSSTPRFEGLRPDTQLARIVFEADVAVKSLSSAPGHKMKSGLPFHQPRLEWQYRMFGAMEIEKFASGEVISTVLVPKAIDLGFSSDGRVISFERAEVGIWVTPKDTRKQASRADLGYAAFLSSHYDEYAKFLQPLWEFRELLKILGAARHLRASGLTLNLQLDRSWTAPRVVTGLSDTASLGTGDNFAFTVVMSGGVTLHVRSETKTTPLAPNTAELMRKASDSLSARQLTATSVTPNAGVCFDGQLGCRHGETLGSIWVGIPQPGGSAGASRAVLDRMRRDPATRQLLESEARAKADLGRATAAVQEKEAALRKTPTQGEKARLQVDLAKVRQLEANAKSAMRVAEIKVEQAVKVIEEVILMDSPKERK